MIYQTILEAMGNTPMIQLQRLPKSGSARVLVKYEGLNVGGSIKTRTAVAMLEKAKEDGLLKPDSVIVEATSGNQGIGLALAGAVMGYKTVIIMPDSVSAERRKLVKQYGAQVVLIHDEGNIGRCIEECLETANRMEREDPRVLIPRQFDNPMNPQVHEIQTAAEILEQVNGPIHGFCSGFGTGGTLSGIGRALRRANPDIEIWALEPEQAAILSGGEIGSHLQMGIGDGVIPKNLDQEVYDEIRIITDQEAINIARALAEKEGLLCGVTGGTNVAAALHLAEKLGEGKTVVTLLPDTGERYFTTPLFQD